MNSELMFEPQSNSITTDAVLPSALLAQNPLLPAVVGVKKYSVIYADPAWSYPESGSKAKVHDKHYKCMSLDDICNLNIKDISDDNCLLFLWVTMPRLFDAQKVIEAWGFQYKTVAFNWVKENKRAANKSLFDDTPIDDFLGLGSWTRSNSEICLLGIKGKMKKQSSSVRQLVVTPIEKHSKKPDCVRDMIVELCGELPRIELFARQNVNGWDAWGNEVSNSIELNAANNGRQRTGLTAVVGFENMIFGTKVKLKYK